ncbi:MAG: Ig-like domain-containing protein [Clostridia bacterium]|nr:Ig-like domain-containing protein [Clostridia bacterium]
MKIKKILSILLAVLLLNTLTPLIACGAEPVASVRQYLNAPSQYTNNANFGINIDATLNGTITSLGNFGGFAVYEFLNPVQNSQNHPYGIDFTIAGNSFNGAATTQEPGQVWVSQDGENWFALAGSEHFEDETQWNYSLTYTKGEGNKCSFSDSLGENGTVNGQYPLKENYPKATFEEDSLTLTGILLRKLTTPSTNNGITTSFGYVDTLPKSASLVNPYGENPQKNGADGQFDISWAVDENGAPVSLDWIKFVKVQTATFINGGIFGEKSTEISALSVTPEGEKIATTEVPDCITVDGEKIPLESDKFTYEITANSSFDLSVETESNVYINNTRGTSRHFDSVPEKGIVRVIVQNGECEPLIYYFNITSSANDVEITLSADEIELEKGKTAQLTATASNGEKINFASSDDSVASVDENGKITANAVGTAFITAKTASGAGKSCKVTVIAPRKQAFATVSFSLSGGEVSVPKKEITVSSLDAENLGYETATTDHNGKSVENVTVFDVISAVHREIYGDDFTKNPEKYLVMSGSFITRAFNQSSSAWGFTVNDVMPNDGIFNPDFGGATGYACDTARVNDGDFVSLFMYKDSRYFEDLYPLFDAQNYTANAGEKFTINLTGYGVMEHGINTLDDIKNKYATALNGVEIFAVINGENVSLGKTDKKGNAKIKFSEEGEYTIFVSGETADGTPVITNFATVTVTQNDNKKPTTFCGWLQFIWQKIVSFFKKIGEFFVSIFKG